MLKHWLLASRPKTLVASLLPVVAGFLLAYEQAPNVSKVTGILCLLVKLSYPGLKNCLGFRGFGPAEQIKNFGPD